MTDTKELIERVKALQLFVENRSDYHRDYYRETCNDILAALSQSQWISVNERLPESHSNYGYSETVLAVDESGQMFCVWILDDEWTADFSGMDEITHWQPLPPPPGE